MKQVYVLKLLRTNCRPKKFMISWVSELLINILNLLPPFEPIFACVDPDQYSKYGSIFRKLLNTDPIQIRIRTHNTTTDIDLSV